MEKFITAAGCALRISDRENTKVEEPNRDKPVLLLLHGYLESLDVWDDFTKLVDRDLRVIAIDLPGHGISEVKGPVHSMEFLADVANGVLDALSIDKCIIAGHSMGGYVSMEFLRKYPDKLNGFVLVHSTPNADTEEKKEQRKREIRLVEEGKKDLLALTVDKGFAEDNRAKFADFIEDLREQVVLTDEEGIKAILRGMMERRENNDVLSGSSVPELLFFGKKDDHINMEVANLIIENNPQARTVLLENSGHMGFVEEADTVAAALVDFCKSVWE